MVKRPFSLDEMQPDRYMPMPSVHYGQNSIVGPKIMRHFCDNLIQILELFIQVSIVFWQILVPSEKMLTWKILFGAVQFVSQKKS